LYLLCFRLADMKLGTDTADARDLAPGKLAGERLRLGRVQPGPVQVPGGYIGYGLGCGPIAISAEPMNATAGQPDSSDPVSPYRAP